MLHRFLVRSALVAQFVLAGCLDIPTAAPVPPEANPRSPDENPDGPTPTPMPPEGGGVRPGPMPPPTPAEDPADDALVQRVRTEAQQRGMRPMAPAPAVAAPLAELGQMLAFDKLLSGNGDLSCMTCHHPSLGTADARSLSIGVDGEGLGMARRHPTQARIPRNAPPMFNLHAQPTMFWDNRVARAPGGQLQTPAGAAITPAMAQVLTFGPAAAQAMFPVTSREEMRGAAGENELADVADDDVAGIWEGLMARLGSIPEYRQLFEAAYPGQSFDQMSFAHAGNAIAAFEIQAFAADDTPWDRFLRGEDDAMSASALRGADLFMGRARCVTCHDGAALSDFRAHNTAVPQVGPGRGDGPGGVDDFGAQAVTGDARLRYAFRTAPLRNVELTAPYGHDGAYVTLGAVLAHYRDPARELRAYDPNVLEPVLRSTLVPNQDQIIATLSPLATPVPMNGQDLDDLRAFMGALTDPASRDLLHTIPPSVPSGLPVAD